MKKRIRWNKEQKKPKTKKKKFGKKNTGNWNQISHSSDCRQQGGVHNARQSRHGEIHVSVGRNGERIEVGGIGVVGRRLGVAQLLGQQHRGLRGVAVQILKQRCFQSQKKTHRGQKKQPEANRKKAPRKGINLLASSQSETGSRLSRRRCFAGRFATSRKSRPAPPPADSSPQTKTRPSRWRWSQNTERPQSPERLIKKKFFSRLAIPLFSLE